MVGGWDAGTKLWVGSQVHMWRYMYIAKVGTILVVVDLLQNNMIRLLLFVWVLFSIHQC